METRFDLYIVGLGGQGVLTIGDLLANAALEKGIPVNFYPTKGMSQRGGFVQGQLRFGAAHIGPSLPPGGADLAVAMERSEALKGVRFIKKGGDFLLYDDVWPTAAMLTGKAAYPPIDAVAEAVRRAGARLIRLNRDALPAVGGKPVRANMFILGALVKNTGLAGLFKPDELLAAAKTFFPKGAETNAAAIRAGCEAKAEV